MPRNIAALVTASLVLFSAAPVRAETPLQSSALVSSSVEAALPLADKVIVRKGERKLYLMNNDAVLRTFRVALGLRPEGHKQFEGDFRTPEGSYRLTRRNAQSDFFLAVQVSYPEASDIAIARRNGWAPGGSIMVHGLPNILKYSRDRYMSTDWTDGCIALSNEDMLDFWLLTGADTPIEIRP